MNGKSMYDQSLECLNDIHETMMSPEYKLSLENQTDEIRAQSGERLLDVEKKRTKLENNKIEKILNDLEKNNLALKEGINQVQKTRQNLNDIQTFLNTVASFLKLLGGIIKLL